MKLRLAALLLLLAFHAAPARAEVLCTLLADAATGAVIHEAGDCDGRVTPASTFKLALAVMGYDAGVLVDAHDPVRPYREGYPDWLGEVWRQPTDPTRWLRYSVVWYSQEIARALGVERLAAYAAAFGYGNADFAGDPGADNALERAWISSSLQISPREQVAFLRALIGGALPVSEHARATTMAIAETHEVAGWTVAGKTGSAFPRRADGSFDRARPWGWYVGWASRGGETVVFARLQQEEERQSGSSGVRARDALFAEWPALVE